MEQVLSNKQKERILKYARSIVHGDSKIMFLYYGGSIAYGTYQNADSDIDVNLVIDGFKGFMHTTIGDIDFFIYGKEYAIKKQNLDNDMPLYFITYIDEVLAIDKTLIYLNPEYKKEFDQYCDIKLEYRIDKYLDVFISYYQHCIDARPNEPTKRLYHVLRLRAIIENFISTGVYSLELTERWRTLIFAYKKNWDNEKGYLIYKNQILKSMEFLKNYRASLRGK